MINNKFIIAAVATLFFAGCSEEYASNRLGSDSPEAKRVVSMISELRQSGADGLDAAAFAQAIPGLTEPQLNGLKSGLKRIVSADDVQLRKIERFGEKVYRAVLSLDVEGRTESMAMLLSPAGGDKLRWIGPN